MSFKNLPRGFKSHSEKIALDFRDQLGLSYYSCLDARDLAKHLDVSVKTPFDFKLDENSLYNLTRNESGWSALTIKINNRNLIIHNPTHSPVRQQTNIMHELAHIICEHPMPKMIIISGMSLPLRYYDPKLEEEADWLSSTLILPRKALYRCKKNNMSIQQIANFYGVSQSLVRMRENLTGISRQFSRDH